MPEIVPLYDPTGLQNAVCQRLFPIMGRDSTVGVATRYGLDGPGIESRWGARFSATVQTGPRSYPTSYTMGTGSFPGGKRLRRCVVHQFHLAPRSKKESSYARLPMWALVACSRVNFTFTFTFTFTLPVPR